MRISPYMRCNGLLLYSLLLLSWSRIQTSLAFLPIHHLPLFLSASRYHGTLHAHRRSLVPAPFQFIEQSSNLHNYQSSRLALSNNPNDRSKRNGSRKKKKSGDGNSPRKPYSKPSDSRFKEDIAKHLSLLKKNVDDQVSSSDKSSGRKKANSLESSLKDFSSIISPSKKEPPVSWNSRIRNRGRRRTMKRLPSRRASNISFLPPVGSYEENKGGGNEMNTTMSNKSLWMPSKSKRRNSYGRPKRRKTSLRNSSDNVPSQNTDIIASSSELQDNNERRPPGGYGDTIGSYLSTSQVERSSLLPSPTSSALPLASNRPSSSTNSSVSWGDFFAQEPWIESSEMKDVRRNGTTDDAELTKSQSLLPDLSLDFKSTAKQKEKKGPRGKLSRKSLKQMKLENVDRPRSFNSNDMKLSDMRQVTQQETDRDDISKSLKDGNDFLFDVSNDKETSSYSQSITESSNTKKSLDPPIAPSLLDGVLPVSELFYRSTQSLSAQENEDEHDEDIGEIKDSVDESQNTDSDKNNNRSGKGSEQARYKTDLAKKYASPRITNMKQQKRQKGDRRKRISSRNNGKLNGQEYSSLSQRSRGKRRSRNNGRKMIRRGMEMLVGGEPINADPPLRCVELSYRVGNDVTSDSYDWAKVITTNSRDFGPLLHGPSVSKVSSTSRGLFCEHFVYNAMKWKVCPRDLIDLIQKKKQERSNNMNIETKPNGNGGTMKFYHEYLESVSAISFDNNNTFHGEVLGRSRTDLGKAKKRAMKNNNTTNDAFTLGGELKFALGITRIELESGQDGSSGRILRRVLGKGLSKAINADTMGFDVLISKVLLNEIERDITEFTVEFSIVLPKQMRKQALIERTANKINASLAKVMDDGEMALAMGDAAREEDSWSPEIRKRIVEEFLYDSGDDNLLVDEDNDDDGDDDDATIDDEDDFESRRENKELEDIFVPSSSDWDGPFGMPGDAIYASDDIFLGGGNGGVFYNYEETNKNEAPYHGSIGPLLVDSVIQRSRDQHPRVIAIGDVHGCLDELQALLRRCDYRPGDQVVFLGDLVSKGPDSLGVVQMAREIGSIGVRGNHDFEVIRWHQAIKSGADPPVIGSEHYTIASTLSKADLKWMYSLPWYLSSKELGALFVHAGFVSGIRLGKQNPRLMMNMRSILPDGTVTSKFFNNWPWARLWDGPQTVLFGHDADRGLQQYEHAIGLDTGCVYGGRLTACILPEKRLVSVNAKREYFQYRRKHFD